MKGTVKFFKDDKGYGFIETDDEKEYFVHISGVEEGVNLQADMSVEFEVEDGDRGPKAVNVKESDAAPAADPEPETDEASDEDESSEEESKE